jgi:hypothetical protein
MTPTVALAARLVSMGHSAVVYGPVVLEGDG